MSAVGMNSRWNVWQSPDLMIHCLPQPLGSFPHMCPDSALRLSRGSQLHLGNSEAGLQKDTLPGKSVWPVQPQLRSMHRLSAHCPYPANGAGHDCSWLGLYIDEGRVRRDGRRNGGGVSLRFSPRAFKLKAKDLRGTNVLTDYFDTEPQISAEGQSIHAVINNVWNPRKYFSLLTTRGESNQCIHPGRLKQTFPVCFKDFTQ